LGNLGFGPAQLPEPGPFEKRAEETGAVGLIDGGPAGHPQANDIYVQEPSDEPSAGGRSQENISGIQIRVADSMVMELSD